MPIPTQRQIEARQENEALRALACLYSVLRRSDMDRGPYMSDLRNLNEGLKTEIMHRRLRRKTEK